MEKIKNIIMISVFAVIIFGFSIAHLLLPDKDVSTSERRKLAKVPEISAETVFSSEFSGDLESYLLDQFPLRDDFRTINAVTRFYVMQQSDSDGIWLSGDKVNKTEYPLDEKQVTYGANFITSICENHLADMNVYFSVIPDKNYFAAEANGYPHIDYDKLVSIMLQGVKGAEYIDIFPTLSEDDYYRTDSHWIQQDIFDTVKALSEAMGSAEYITPYEEYTANFLSPFYGVYMGQAALPVKPDTLTYLESEYTKSATVTGVDDTSASTIYDPSRINGIDGYDVFLSGAQPLLTIECPNAKTDKELIIFRDSYGSSIAPLFTGAYAKITLIDLRYMPSMILNKYVEFNDQDVLFLYSTTLLNSAMLLK